MLHKQLQTPSLLHSVSWDPSALHLQAPEIVNKQNNKICTRNLGGCMITSEIKTTVRHTYSIARFIRNAEISISVAIHCYERIF